MGRLTSLHGVFIQHNNTQIGDSNVYQTHIRRTFKRIELKRESENGPKTLVDLRSVLQISSAMV